MRAFNSLSLLTVLLCQTAAAWRTTIRTLTITESSRGFTHTESARELTLSGTTITVPATTVSAQAGTETETTTIREHAYPLERPPAQGDSEANGILLVLKPELTTLDPSVASKFASDISVQNHGFATANPVPPSFNKALNDIQVIFPLIDRANPNAGPNPQNQLLLALVNNFFGPPEDFSRIASFLSPYPSLQTEVFEMMGEVARYFAPEYAAEISILEEEIDPVTNPAAQSYASRISDFLPGGTGVVSISGLDVVFPTVTSGSVLSGSSSASSGQASSSTSAGEAAATADAHMMINAGLAAAGIAMLALL